MMVLLSFASGLILTALVSCMWMVHASMNFGVLLDLKNATVAMSITKLK